MVRPTSVIHRTISSKFVKRMGIQKCVPMWVDFAICFVFVTVLRLY